MRRPLALLAPLLAVAALAATSAAGPAQATGQGCAEKPRIHGIVVTALHESNITCAKAVEHATLLIKKGPQHVPGYTCRYGTISGRNVSGLCHGNHSHEHMFTVHWRVD